MVVMVVGGNGQLGASCCAELRRRGQVVRATVRDYARAGGLENAGAEVVLLDVTDPVQRRGALAGVDALILSANAVAPRAGDDPAAFDAGLSALLDEALSEGVGTFVLPSVPAGPSQQQVPPMLAKRSLSAILRIGCSTDQRRAGCCACRRSWRRGLPWWARRCPAC